MIAFDRLGAGCRFFGTRRRGDAEDLVRAAGSEMTFRGIAWDRERFDDLRGSASPREIHDCPVLEAGTQ